MGRIMLDVILSVLGWGFILTCAVLMFRTWGHYKSPRFPGIFDVLRPEIYSGEGLRRRRLLLRSSLYGALTVATVVILANWLIRDRVAPATKTPIGRSDSSR
jgi:hypothetical protein